MPSIGAGWTRPLYGGGHGYNALIDEPADAHEMRDIRSLKLPDGNVDLASVHSATAPLLPASKSQDITNDNHVVRKKRKRDTRLIHGWRMGVALCAGTASTVFLINVVLTVWASVKYGLVGGIGTIQAGSCARTKNLSLWLHLAINALSTILLAASNYSMQCIASPTREEIDKAHKLHTWLDIGVPTVRNLRKISWYRIVLWWLLAISGVPLHLLYNSAVFSTLSSQEYTVFEASPDLLSGSVSNWSTPLTGTSFTFQDFRNVSSWEKLENAACIKAYGAAFVSSRGNVVAITSGINATELIRGYAMQVGSDGRFEKQPYGWMCEALTDAQSRIACDIGYLSERAKDWKLLKAPFVGEQSRSSAIPIDYCLSELIEEHCQVQFSIIIMSIIIVCNLLKALCMFLALWRERAQPLVTLGDAMDSFLRIPDPTTEKLCLADKSAFASAGNAWVGGPRVWRARSYRWFSSASKKRWLICNILCVVTIIAAGALLNMGLENRNINSRSISHLWRLGYGTVTSESVIGWDLKGSGGLMITVLVANAPQVILSFLFLTYNGLYTCMLLADEWNGYAHDRKPLRVTDPIGDQRSTYRLQLPYKYGIPLLILSGTLHWLVSQSLFLARVSSYDGDGEIDDYGSLSTVGYSCIAIITVIALGSVIVIIGVLIGFRRYKQGIPLAGSSSAAISAACHRPKDDEDAASKAVMWGVVEAYGQDGVGHCCLTSFEVSPPVKGERYAGLEGTDGHSTTVLRNTVKMQATGRDHE